MVARDRVRYAGDVVAAVAADDEAAALAALAVIDVVYEELPPLPDVPAALAENAPELFPGDKPPGIVPPYGTGASGHLWPRPNVCYEFRYATGSEEVWEGATTSSRTPSPSPG